MFSCFDPVHYTPDSEGETGYVVGKYESTHPQYLAEKTFGQIIEELNAPESSEPSYPDETKDDPRKPEPLRFPPYYGGLPGNVLKFPKKLGPPVPIQPYPDLGSDSPVPQLPHPIEAKFNGVFGADEMSAPISYTSSYGAKFEEDGLFNASDFTGDGFSGMSELELDSVQQFSSQQSNEQSINTIEKLDHTVDYSKSTIKHNISLVDKLENNLADLYSSDKYTKLIDELGQKITTYPKPVRKSILEAFSEMQIKNEKVSKLYNDLSMALTDSIDDSDLEVDGSDSDADDV